MSLYLFREFMCSKSNSLFFLAWTSKLVMLVFISTQGYDNEKTWTWIYNVPHSLFFASPVCFLQSHANDTGCNIRLKNPYIFPMIFTIFPILALCFWKIAPILSPIFLLQATWSPVIYTLLTIGIFPNSIQAMFLQGTESDNWRCKQVLGGT